MLRMKRITSVRGVWLDPFVAALYVWPCAPLAWSCSVTVFTLHILLMQAKSRSSMYFLNFSGNAEVATHGAELSLDMSEIRSLLLMTSRGAGFGGTNRTDFVLPPAPRASAVPCRAWIATGLGPEKAVAKSMLKKSMQLRSFGKFVIQLLFCSGSVV